PAPRNAARPLPPLRARPRDAVLAPEGHGDLERARRPAPARERQARLRRGVDAADVRRRDLEDLGPLGEVQGRDVPRPLRRGADARPEADELPRSHAAVRLDAAQLPRPAAALRRSVDAAPQRACGLAARPAPRSARYAGRRAP